MKVRRFFFIIVFFCSCCSLQATNYYINSAAGNDSWKGTNPSQAWKTTAPLRGRSFQPGDSVLFASGQRFSGMLSLVNVRGTDGRPVVISSYRYKGSLARPVLDAGEDLYALHIQNSSFIVARGLEITGQVPVPDSTRFIKGVMRCGLLVEVTTDKEYEQIRLEQLVVHDVYLHPPGFTRSAAETRTANGTEGYGWGIRFINNSKKGKLSRLQVLHTTIYNVCHTGLKFTANNNGIKDVTVAHCKIYHTGGPGLQLSGVQDGHIHHNTIRYSGSTRDSRNWGRGSGMWTWSCRNMLIEHNRFENANGPGDSAGVHIDYNCNDIVVQYNFSANNAGGFCEILGNNYNCAYRYNISVNDGFREKGVNGAFQEGKVFWLSGYQGNDKKKAGPYNSYFYNNTMYVPGNSVPKIAVTGSASGVLLMNNIFYFEGAARNVSDDQKKSEAETGDIPHVVFKNNLFLRADNWPAGIPIRDVAPLTGDPGFKNKGGLQAEDYIPANRQLVVNQGQRVMPVPHDSIGLRIGMHVTRDILGNLVRGNPDLGAIELNDEK